MSHPAANLPPSRSVPGRAGSTRERGVVVLRTAPGWAGEGIALACDGMGIEL